MSKSIRDQFEEAYSEQYKVPLSALVENRSGDRNGTASSYKDIGIEHAFRGWLLHEDHVHEQLELIEPFTEFMKDFFIAFKAFGVHTSPIARRKESEFEADARERMESLFARGCALVKYDEAEITDRILAEAKDDAETFEEDGNMPDTDDVQVRGVAALYFGNDSFVAGNSIKIGYTLVTGQHWFDSYNDGVVSYTLHRKNPDAEYVDVVVLCMDERYQNILKNFHQNLMGVRYPMVRTASDFKNGFIVRFTIPHGEFITEMLGNKG